MIIFVIKVGKTETLVELELPQSGILEAPYSIGCLKKLKMIKVYYIVIRKLPHNIRQVKMIEDFLFLFWNYMPGNVNVPP